MTSNCKLVIRDNLINLRSKKEIKDKDRLFCFMRYMYYIHVYIGKYSNENTIYNTFERFYACAIIERIQK